MSVWYLLQSMKREGYDWSMASQIRVTSEEPLLASAYDIISRLGGHSNPRRKWRALLGSGAVKRGTYNPMYAFDKRAGETPAVDMDDCKAILSAMNVVLPPPQMRELESRLISLRVSASGESPLTTLTRTVQELVVVVDSLRSEIRALKKKKQS